MRQMRIHKGISWDGINWNIYPEPINFISKTRDELESIYKYDPRVIWLEDRYYIAWCHGYYGPTIGVGYTFDFEKFYQLENALLPYNRNGVLFPRKINGKYAMFSRPSDSGHTPFGDIFYSESPDMIHWGCHRHGCHPKVEKVIGRVQRLEPDLYQLETKEGRFLIYYGVLTSCHTVTDLSIVWGRLYWTLITMGSNLQDSTIFTLSTNPV